MESIAIQKDAQANVANGSNQDVISIDLSAYTSDRPISVEVFFTMRYQNDASIFYIRTAEVFSTSDTRNTGFSPAINASYSYSQSTTSTVHTPTVLYEQSNSTLYIRATNNTGSTQTVTYQVSYVLNYN